MIFHAEVIVMTHNLNLSILKLTPVCLSLLIGCAKQPPATVGDGSGNNPPNNGQEKPTMDVAPGFSESQFKKGQWIAWKKIGSDGTNECVRWQVADFFSDGIQLEGRTSKDCVNFNSYLVDHILFDPKSGKVTSHVISNPNSSKPDPGALQGESIYPSIYGAPEKVEFRTGKHFKDTQKKEYYPAYQIKNKSSIYLNRPGTPFHAFVLLRKELNAGKTWTYTLHSSDPAIETVIDKP